MITLAKRLLRYKFIRFLITGIINTAFSYCCFIAFMFFIKIKEIAVTLELLTAVFFNYNMSSRFVFQKKKSTIKQIVKFYAVYFITYPLNLFHLYITVDLWNWNVYFSQFVTLFYMPVISFILQRRIVFRDTTNKEIKKQWRGLS